MTHFQALKLWRQDRNMSANLYNHRDEVAKDVEELFELIGYQDTDRLVEEFMDKYYKPELEPSEEDKLDAHQDKIIFAINATAALGYVPELALKETIKHISSRNIDPLREKDFRDGLITKWPKDPNQLKDTLYEPNYKLARAHQS